MRRLFLYGALAAAASLLGGCGGGGSASPSHSVKVAGVKTCLDHKGVKTNHNGSFIPQTSGGYVNAQFDKYDVTIILTNSSGELDTVRNSVKQLATAYGASEDLVDSLMWDKDNALVYVDGTFVKNADKQTVLSCV